MVFIAPLMGGVFEFIRAIPYDEQCVAGALFTKLIHDHALTFSRRGLCDMHDSCQIWRA